MIAQRIAALTDKLPVTDRVWVAMEVESIVAAAVAETCVDLVSVERRACAEICKSMADKARGMGDRHPEDSTLHGQAESMALTLERMIMERGQ